MQRSGNIKLQRLKTNQDIWETLNETIVDVTSDNYSKNNKNTIEKKKITNEFANFHKVNLNLVVDRIFADDYEDEQLVNNFGNAIIGNFSK